MGREALAQERQTVGQRIELECGHHFLQGRFVVRLKHLYRSVVSEVTIVKSERLEAVDLVFGIATPIAGREIHSAVAVEVARRYAIPPTSELVEGLVNG